MCRFTRTLAALALTLAGLLVHGEAAAQQTSVTPEVDDRYTVFLVTAAPGDAIWERFGHNGLWIHDASTGEDLFWEWGLFSFTQSGFIARLARGTMLYAMAGRPLDGVVASYRAANRSLWAQELALEPAQEAELDRFVRNNARPENRDYTYHYYLDNCSTRARDALDHALGGQIEAAFQAESAGVSWRWHTRRLLGVAPLAEAGVQLVLGQPGDAVPSAYQEMFLPMRMRAHLQGMSVVGADGAVKPLVTREIQLATSTRPPEPSEPIGRLPVFGGLGLLLAVSFVLLGRWASRGSRWGLRALGVAAVGWCGVVGVLGLLVALAWAFTDHDFWRWNENLLLANPFLLVAVPFALPLLLGRVPDGRLTSILAVLAGSAALASLLQVLPGLDQQNGEIVALLVPAHLALAWTVTRLGKAPTRA